jgi:hypothetical protein
VSGDDRPPLARITVNLTPRAAEALDLACARTRDTKTDAIGRALVVYAAVLDLLDRSCGVLTVVLPDGSTEAVHLL